MMTNLDIDLRLLTEFESGIDPLHPDAGKIPAKVLGYGEISTVLAADHPGLADVALKRMPMFKSDDEAKRYETLYAENIKILEDRIGVRTVPSRTVFFPVRAGRNGVAYIVQPKLRPETLAQNAIHRLPDDGVRELVLAALREIKKIFDFNRRQGNPLEVGADGQISNWAITGNAEGVGGFELAYLDTSTPLVRKSGKEQIDTELFMRSAPSFLVWIIRALFLKDVVERYYDFRKVTIDLIANFYKEQRADLVPSLIETANRFFAGEAADYAITPITQKEVEAYYKEDALIWRIYLFFRKIDRALHRLVGKQYPYVLPASVKR